MGRRRSFLDPCLASGYLKRVCSDQIGTSGSRESKHENRNSSIEENRGGYQRVAPSPSPQPQPNRVFLCVMAPPLGPGLKEVDPLHYYCVSCIGTPGSSFARRDAPKAHGPAASPSPHLSLCYWGLPAGFQPHSTPAPASAVEHQQCIRSPLAGGEYTS